MTTIQITAELPYVTNDRAFKAIRVEPIGFTKYALTRKAAAGAKTEAQVRSRTAREQIKFQCVAIDDNGKEHRFSDDDISAMPIPYAISVRDAMTLALFPADAGEAAILAEGNGISSAILVKLGSPIKMQGGQEIAELEFQAGTVSQLEDVISLDSHFEQTEALLAIAKPATGTLLSLPSWAISQISLADGIFIMNKVRPAFFEAQIGS